MTSIREPLQHDPDDWRHAERGLDWLFPGVAAPVPADWFAGELVSPRDHASVSHDIVRWPAARVFHVERGTIVGTELRDSRADLLAQVSPSDKLLNYLDLLQ